MNVNPIVIPSGITPGSPFAQGHLVYVSATTPTPTLSSYAARVSTDSGTSVVYTDIPDNSGTYVTTTGLNETLRVKGGAVIEGSAAGSVQIGPGATASVANGVAIGNSAVNSGTAGVTIGNAATSGGQAGVVIGATASLANAAGVAVGAGANVNGAAGGSNGVAIGQAATTNTNAGSSSPIAIGLNANAQSDCVVIGSNASSNINHAIGVGSVVIGSGATSNKAQGFNVCIGYTATVTQTNAVAIGSGATVTAAASQTYSIAIGAGTTITGTQSITIGGGGANIGDNTMQLGAPSTIITTFVLGGGNTVATPAARTIRFTNGSGTDNAAGNVTLTAPLSTGAATAAKIIFAVGIVGASSATVQTAQNVISLAAPAANSGTIVFETTTARIRMGSANGIAFQNAAGAADRVVFADSGATFDFSDGTNNVRLIPAAASGERTAGGSLSTTVAGGTWLDSVGATTTTGSQGIIYSNGTQRYIALAISNYSGSLGAGVLRMMESGGNVVLGGTAVGATSNGVLGFARNATEPTASVDLVHLYGFDLSAGNRALACYAEAALIASIDQVVTNKVPFRYNGTTLYLMATTSAA